jgi:hypothetical protein
MMPTASMANLDAIEEARRLREAAVKIRERADRAAARAAVERAAARRLRRASADALDSSHKQERAPDHGEKDRD